MGVVGVRQLWSCPLCDCICCSLPVPSLQLEEASSRSVRLQSQVESLEEAAKDKEEASRGQQ